MNLAKLSVRRPVTTVMVVLIAVSFGIISILNLKLDMLPNMDIPIAIVSTTYEGTGPEEMENLITAPLESVLGTVAGVSELSSTSSNGSSIVIVRFEDGTDIDIAALDMRERIDLIKGMLPSDADDPMVMKIDINSMSGISVGITSEAHDMVELKRLVEDRVVNRIERQDGVASVSLSGGLEKEITVTVETEKLRGYGIAESAIQQILMVENLDSPVGSVKQGDKTLQARVSGKFATLEEIKNIPITTATGATVFLQDIAAVEETYKEITSSSYINGVPSINLTIQKQSTANTVNVSDAVLEEIERIRTDLPELEITIMLDPADMIRWSISNVTDSAVQGGILAVIILYIFLRNVRSTLVVAAAMPISVISTFALMYYANITLNMMSLGGLTLGIGMLVDNSIVVLESIYRKIEDGVERKEAAIEGAREVTTSVIASTLTTVAVFLPISFAGGLIAQIFNQLSLTIAFSLMSSLAVSLTFVPMMCSIILRKETVEGKHSKINVFTKVLDIVGSGIKNLESGYKVLLAACLKRKKLTVVLAFIFVILTFSSLRFVGMAFLPASDEGTISITASMPKGTLLEETEKTAFEIAEIVGTVPEVTEIDVSVGGGGISLTGSSTDNASITILLTDKQERPGRSADTIAREIEDMLHNIPGTVISVQASSSSMGNYSSSGVQIDIKGEEFERLEEISNDIAGIVMGVAGAREVETSFEDASPQATIHIDRVKAAAYGISSASVSSLVRTAITGSVATTYKIDGVEFDIRVRQDTADINFVNDIENILIPSPMGVNVPLYELAEIVVEDTPVSVSRTNQQRYVSVTALLDGVSFSVLTANISSALASYPMPEGYTWEYSGSSTQMDEAFTNLALALVLAVFLVYMIMAAEFESLVYPFIVMFSIPIALTGGLFGLFVTGQELTITGFLGLIMLAGVVINNAIVLIDYTNLLIREQDMTLHDALMKAGPIRLRPILMTTLTTVLALIPMMVSNGQGAEMMRGLAITVVFGLSLSTLVTLLLIPVVYMALTTVNQRRKEKKAARLEKKAALGK